MEQGDLTPLPGACTPRFVALRPLGRGGFGTVWLAREVGPDRLVAIKVLVQNQDAAQHRRFRREAALAATFRHPHIVEIVHHDADGSEPWIAYEYVAGQTLRSRIEAGRVAWRDAIEIAIRIAEALGYAHERGVVHRDVKPENVLEAQDTQKLCDFGAACWADASGRLTATGQLLCTPTYMAPELITGESVGPTYDVYALGIILFELLTGQPPFRAGSPAEIAVLHVQEPVPRAARAVADLPPALDRLLARILAKQPGDRPADGRQLAGELVDFLARASSISASGRRTALARTCGAESRPGSRARHTLAISQPTPPGGPARRSSAPASQAAMRWMLAVALASIGVLWTALPVGPGPAPRTSLAPSSPASALVRDDLHAQVQAVRDAWSRFGVVFHRARAERRTSAQTDRIRAEAPELVRMAERVVAHADGAGVRGAAWMALLPLRSEADVVAKLMTDGRFRTEALERALAGLGSRLRRPSPDPLRRIAGNWLAERIEAASAADGRRLERSAVVLSGLLAEFGRLPEAVGDEGQLVRAELMLDQAGRWRTAADQHASLMQLDEAARAEEHYCDALRQMLAGAASPMHWIRRNAAGSARARQVLMLLVSCAEDLARSTMRSPGDVVLSNRFLDSAVQLADPVLPHESRHFREVRSRIAREGRAQASPPGR